MERTGAHWREWTVTTLYTQKRGERTEPAYMSAYRLMWMLVMFDLPVDTAENRKAANDFRNDLLDFGFERCQFFHYDLKFFHVPTLNLRFKGRLIFKKDRRLERLYGLILCQAALHQAAGIMQTPEMILQGSQDDHNRHAFLCQAGKRRKRGFRFVPGDGINQIVQRACARFSAGGLRIFKGNGAAFSPHIQDQFFNFPAGAHPVPRDICR